jgi:peptidyl-prolyl cis-trans isomerase A (cyclophilin A)
MIRILRLLAIAAALALPNLAHAAGLPRVEMKTDMGSITIELEVKKAPITAKNFLRYVDEKRFDNTVFYRAAPTKGTKARGFIQGGVQHRAMRILPPIAHEPTSKTGLRHLDGTISMAREAPGTAMGDFFITVGPTPSMDAKGKDPGYAAFGHVVKGMDVVRKIMGGKRLPNAGIGSMKGQYLATYVKILTARRIG